MQKRHLAATLAALALCAALGGCGDGQEAKETESGAEISVESSVISESSQDASPEPGAEEEEALSEEAAALFDAIQGWRFRLPAGSDGSVYLVVDAKGNFSGSYHEEDQADAGEGYAKGTLRLSEFEGKFTDVTKVTDCVYEVKVSDLTYLQTPGDVKTEGDVRYVYTEGYGIADAESLQIFLPGARIAKLPEKYAARIKSQQFTVSANGVTYTDVPAELPFCGMFNQETEECFTSQNGSGKNAIYMVNRGSFPGLQSQTQELNADGTYFYEDVPAGALYLVRNLCYRVPEGGYGSEDALVADAIAHFNKGEKASEFYAVKPSDQDTSVSVRFVNGYPSYLAGWSFGSNEDTRYNVARIVRIGNFVYVYGYSSSEYDDLMHGEAGTFFLSSLTFSADAKKISSASGENMTKKICAHVIAKGADFTKIYADEAVWVNSYDTELMEKYGLTEDDMYDDYAIVGLDGKYAEYELAEDCAIYVQYPEEGPFDELQGKAAFHKKLEAGTYDYLMMLFLDDKGKVVFMYEPFRP